MTSRSLPILVILSSLLFASCEEASTPKNSSSSQNCDSTYIPACSSDLRASNLCIHAQITNVPCSINETCNVLTGLCTPNTTTTDPTIPQDPVEPQEPVEPQNPVIPQEPVKPQDPTNDLLCDSTTFTPTCLNTHSLRICLNNILTTQTCASGMECIGNACKSTGSSNAPTVTTGNPGEKCDPNTFTERCYGTTEAIACIEQFDANGESTGSYKVEKIDCVKNYGKKYICDIFEDFYGDGRDIVGCFSDAEKCSTLGESYTVCEDDSTYEDVEYNEYFSTSTYRCVHGVLNDYYYFESSVPCPGNCNKDKTGCK